jgi:hypothetical protein
MKGRNLLVAVPALLLAMACENPQQPDRHATPGDPSKVISDGTRAGGNPDFFFLPPLVPNPSSNSNFERGKFNNALQPSLTIEICELVAEPAGALPTSSTACANDVATPRTAPVKTFGPGTVRQVGLPKTQSGWWTTQNLPDEGFYYVLWDTRQSNLDVSKYYRIKVLVAGSSIPLGYADVDPMQNMREWHNVRTGDVIPLVDDAMLPIPFRVERGALCAGGNCNSATITNNSPTGSQSIVVDAGGGSIAGAKFPNGWLPEGGPQSVVVTVAEVPVGLTTGIEGGPTVCHPGLPFQQFRGCFNYSTTPALDPINEAGDQFAQPVTVAVCFELEGSGDPREKFAELYASDVNEPAHALEDVPDGGLLGVTTKDCSADPVIAQSSNRWLQLASSGWRKMKTGLGSFFGVKTAYAVDLGLGGIVKGFSNIGPVLPAQLQVEGPTDLGIQSGDYILNVMVVGSNHHAEHAPGGIGNVPVTFSVASVTQGTVGQHFTAVGAVTPTSVESITRDDSETRGEASAIWHLPAEPGTYTLTVTAKATGSPVTFTATVPPPIAAGVVGFDAPDIGGNARQVINPYTDAATGIVFSAGPSGIVGISRNLTSGTSVCVAPLLADGSFGTGDGNQKLGTAPVGGTSIGLSAFPITATFPTTMPAGTLVSVEVQTGTPTTGDGIVELRFLDASGAQVGSISLTAIGPDVRCAGAPGEPRMKFVLSNVGSATAPAFKSLVVVGPGNSVFLIDNLRFGQPGSFD